MSDPSEHDAAQSADPSVEEHRTNCRACPAGCGVLVKTSGIEVLGVRGDGAHPLSRGYLCIKGKRLPWAHHRADRLDHPVLRSVATGWTEMLDDLAGSIDRLVGDHGPDSLGLYRATGAGLDTLGARTSQGFFDAIGSRQRYSPLTVDHAAALRATELVSGSADILPTWVPEDEQSRLVLFVGSNPVVSHGYLTILPDPLRRIRTFQRRGGRVWVADPRRTQTAAIANGHVSLRPGSDAALLAWLAGELLADAAYRLPADPAIHASDVDRLRDALAPFDLATVATATDAPASQLEELLTEVRRAGRLAVVSGSGVTFGPHALVAEWLRWVVLIVTGSLDAPGGMACSPGWLTALEDRPLATAADADDPDAPAPLGPRSRPELAAVLGQQPCVALADEIEAGNVRGLIVAGGSPLTAFPDPDRGARALASLEVLVVIDVVETPLTRIATHLLPAAGQLERADILAFNGRTSHAREVVPVGADRWPMWKMFARLGRRFGFDLTDESGADDHTDRATDLATERRLLRGVADAGQGGAEVLVSAGSHGVAGPRLDGWVRSRVLAGDGWQLAPAELIERLPAILGGPAPDGLVLINRRQTSRTNSTAYTNGTRAHEQPVALLHPDDARTAGIVDATTIEISSDTGAVRAVASLDATMRRGTVSLPHGWHGTNVGHLTSSRAGIDPQTGVPRMTTVPVRIATAPTETTSP